MFQKSVKKLQKMENKSIEGLPIPEDEKNNLRKFLRVLKNAGNESGYDVETEVVGGAVNKPWPRKDIDVTVKTGKRGKGETELDRARDEFETLSKIAKKAIEIDGDFSIDKVIEPAMDEEFGSPDIMKFDGVVQILPKKGARIELIRKK